MALSCILRLMGIAKSEMTGQDGKTVRERSVRAGGECYRVACIADAIASARSGSGPSRWREEVRLYLSLCLAKHQWSWRSMLIVSSRSRLNA